MINNFDWKFYTSYYVDLHNFTKIQAEHHYINHGIYENRAKNNEHIQNNLNISNNEIYNYNNLIFKKQTEECINICIRTSNRPEYYNLCIESILQQKYTNYNIFISYDKKESIKYVHKYFNRVNIFIYFIELPNIQKYKFNLYLNILMEKIKKGWIMFLDDDDQLTNYNSLKIINEYLTYNNNLLIWKFLKPDKIIYPINKNNIKLGQIANCSFIFHSYWKNISKFEDIQGGDYYFYQNYIQNSIIKPNIIILNYILTKTTDEYYGSHYGKTIHKLTPYFFINYIVNYKYIFKSYLIQQNIISYIMQYI